MHETREHGPPGDDRGRVLVFAPGGRNAAVLRDLMARSGIAAEACAGVEDLLRAIRGEAGALLLTEEALPPSTIDRVVVALGEQPPWSDLPVVLIAEGEPPARGWPPALRALHEACNMIVVQRPAPALMLATTVRSSLRARRRQFEVRDLLGRSEALNGELLRTIERERLAVEAAELGFWGWDVAAGYTHWDPRHNRMMGLPEGQAGGRFDEWMDRVDARDRPRVVGALGETVAGRGRFEAEFRSTRPDGTSRWVAGLGRAVRDDSGATVRVLGVVQDVTDRKGLEESLRVAHDELEARIEMRTAELARANAALRAEIAARHRAEEARQDLLRRLGTAQEAERQRIARDLHDQFGQLLTALILGLGAVQGAGPLPPRTLDILKKVRAVADELGRSVHDLAVTLRPTALDDLGLHAALQALLEGAGMAGVRISFQADGIATHRLPPEVETVLYRVVQEAINNACKHAHARHLGVIVVRRDGLAVAVVEDDGDGFDAARPAAPGGGLGLLGMRERVGLLGGTLEVESAPGRGTTVVARVPLDGHESARD